MKMIQPGERQMAVFSNKAFPAKKWNYYRWESLLLSERLLTNKSRLKKGFVGIREQ